MEEKDEWVFFKEIGWSCPKNNQFNVDTRDFHVGYRPYSNHKDYDTLKKYKHFFFTEEELKTLLERLYIESGGEKEWRLLELESDNNVVKGWRLKYLRIWRTELGFVICNSDEIAIRKEELAKPVDSRY